MYDVLWTLAGVGGAFLILFFLRNEPTYIGCQYLNGRWLFLIMGSFLILLICISYEFKFALWVGGFADNNVFMHFAKKVVENGFLIPVISALVSWGFGFCVRKMKLDYVEPYNTNVSKICFSAFTLIICLVYGLFTYQVILKSGYDNLLVDTMISRILMWLLVIVGTWIGFGFGCKGRIEQHNELIRKYKHGREVPLKETIIFWMFIGGAIILCAIISLLGISRYSSIIQRYLLFFVSALSITGGIICAIRKWKYNPSEVVGHRNYLKAEKIYESGKPAEGQVRNQHFHLINNELIVDKRNVIYEGHMDDPEFIALFGEKKISLSEDFDGYEFLEKRDRLQEEYIESGKKDCLEELKRRQIEK